MSMIPNTSVSPAASRNSIRPNCRPFSVCSRTRMAMFRSFRVLSSFQRALLRIRVRMIFDHGAERLVGDASLAVFLDDAQVEVLDREAVAVDLERTAHGFEIVGPQHLAQRVGIL